MQEKLKFIKKNRPKLKQGDVFYYFINGKFYFGIVLLTQLNPSIKDGIDITVLLPNYFESSVENFKKESFINCIYNRNLLAPQTIINKRAWLLGFFVNFKTIELSELNILEFLRFEAWGKVYDYNYQEVNNIPELSLFGSAGLYGYEGIEYLIQVGIGLCCDENEDPYSYYTHENFQKMIKGRSLPYWYYNSISKNI
ncbi:hypothetical protein ACLSY0_06325 [Avibacterium avium]|uniref:hypothetical protein n=4 Tax=Avibacterium avium TaxID=751 RepID=UPI003BF903FB